MQHRVFGKTGLLVSPLGFGGAEIGFHGASVETVTTLLNAALDAGLNVIDTAECYPGSEELIAAAVAHRRSQYHLFTKVGHEHGLSQPEDWSEASITRTIDRSLTRLRTDRLDLVQLHSCKADVLRKGEAVAALEKAKKAGKTRFIGYSGDSADARVAVDMGVFDALQTSVSIADQESIELLLPEAHRRGMGVIAKRPIANAAWRDAAEPPSSAYHHTYWLRLRELAYPAVLQSPASAAQTALRFTLSLREPGGEPLVHTAIVGTTNPTRWRENAQLVEQGDLPGAEVQAIRARWKQIARSDWVGQI